ncbi:response regulator [Lunatimonas lonarensis]|uniref:Response regulator n=1 Tax=Lunatimonas lonarensis TaxID=1232681 RepID=R7ZP50_9BACT|nr:response regulator [Lunatimonas lonarensis]
MEDNEGDILLTREALEECQFDHDLSVVRDGKEAIQFLLREEPYTSVRTPNLVLLDINLPKKSGHEVLKTLKTTDEIKHIPVIMLTTSSSESDVMNSYKNHANCFITKPVDIDEFIRAFSMINKFWLHTAVLPTNVPV